MKARPDLSELPDNEPNEPEPESDATQSGIQKAYEFPPGSPAFGQTRCLVLWGCPGFFGAGKGKSIIDGRGRSASVSCSQRCKVQACVSFSLLKMRL